MKPRNGKKRQDSGRRPTEAGLKTLVGPVAAYVAATDDPRAAVAEIVAELMGEAIAIEVAAFRCLDHQARRQEA